MIDNIKEIVKAQYKNYVKKQNKFVFTHVPKCAGSALSRSLLQGLYPSVVRNSPLTTGIDVKLANSIGKKLGIEEQKVREVHLATFLESQKKVFITGHCYANPVLVNEYCNDWNFITVLRDPTDRFISEYVYNTFKKETWKNNEKSFDEYITGKQGLSSSITYARFFSGLSNQEIFENPAEAIDISVNNLKNFYKVGFLDELNSWVDELNGEFNASIKINRTNSSPNSKVFEEITASEEKMKSLCELCEIDTAIYKKMRVLK